jgi:hypothetical protein
MYLYDDKGQLFLDRTCYLRRSACIFSLVVWNVYRTEESNYRMPARYGNAITFSNLYSYAQFVIAFGAH